MTKTAKKNSRPRREHLSERELRKAVNRLKRGGPRVTLEEAERQVERRKKTTR